MGAELEFRGGGVSDFCPPNIREKRSKKVFFCGTECAAIIILENWGISPSKLKIQAPALGGSQIQAGSTGGSRIEGLVFLPRFRLLFL